MTISITIVTMLLLFSLALNWILFIAIKGAIKEVEKLKKEVGKI